MNDWQDILSAPRDGSFIQGIDEERTIFRCRWYSREEIAEWNGSDVPQEWDPAWYESDESDEEVFPVAWRPMKA